VGYIPSISLEEGLLEVLKSN